MGTYRLYIDESGTHDYHDYSIAEYNQPPIRYLGIIGIAIERGVYIQAKDDLENLKKKNLKYDPDIPIILHRNDIINRRLHFYVLQDSKIEQAFNTDLINYVNDLDCTLIMVVVDKKYLIDRYGQRAFHPYHYALTAMMERYCGFLNFFNHKGDIIAESRQRKEDMSLKAAYSHIYNNGTDYHDASFFQSALTTKEIKIKSKTANLTGLQIADILAHPCKQELLLEEGRISQYESKFGQILCSCVKDKYNKQFYSEKISGYGKIFLG